MRELRMTMRELGMTMRELGMTVDVRYGKRPDTM